MTDPAPALRLSVGLASAAALAYEIVLLRFFSITQFHHTAYMVISLALLGYAASGTVLAIGVGRRVLERPKLFGAAYGGSLCVAALSMLVAFSLAERVAVHPEELLWDPAQALRLVGVYLILSVPFFLVGSAVGLALMRFRAGTVYAWDLAGAGMGSLLAVAALWILEPQGVLRCLASITVVAALAGLSGSPRRGAGLAFGLTTLVAIWVSPASWLELRLSPYKSLSQALRVEGARVVAVRSSPVSRVTVLENDVVPLRHAPGLSLAAPRQPPEQIGLFIDGDVLTPIVRAGDRESLSYLDYSTEALAFHVTRPARVLVLGAGGGESVLRARTLGAEKIVALELDPQVVRLVRDDYAEYSGDVYGAPEVDLVAADIRGWLAATRPHGDEDRFDLVEHAALGGFGGGGPLLASLAESYLYTVEALEEYLERLRPSGLLAMTGWAKNPPRDTVKLVATALAALERRARAHPDDGEPATRLAVIRGWQTSTVLIKRGSFTAAEIDRLREFCRQRYFDVVYYPGMEAAEANRYNRLAEPSMHRAVTALLGPDREGFLDDYPFDVSPTTDDRPFFHQFFRWRTLPEIVESRGSGSLSLLEAGYLVLVITLLQGAVLGGALIAVPWVALRRSAAGAAAPSSPSGPMVVYFLGLGLGFLLLEVAFLQKLVLLLHHPVYAAAAVLAGFLAFAGLGSAASAMLERLVGRRAIPLAVTGVVVLGAIDLWLFRSVVPALAGAPLLARIAISCLMIAPLAAFMGTLFPLGLDRVRRRSEGLVPWAWAINGSASVVSPILATLLAIQYGFSMVIVAALLVYGVAGVAFGRSSRGSAPDERAPTERW